MSLFGKNKKRASGKGQEEAPKWKIASFEHEGEGKKVKGRKVYGLWGAMKYTLVLSLMLWWLPVFGQMIAGYVGGRKAGSPWKGVLAAILPVVGLFAVMALLDHFLAQAFSTGSATSATLLAGFATGMPIIGPYLEFTRDYVTRFIDSLAGSSPYGLNSYIITMAFAYIGGILADQTRREIEAVSGAAGSHTTVVVTPNEGHEHGLAARMQNIPIVGSFMSGRMAVSRQSHPKLRMKKKGTESFDRMVAIKSLEDSDDGVIRADGSEDQEGRSKRVKKVNHHHHVEVSAKPVAPHHAHHDRPAIVSPAKHGNMRSVERKIEKEWDPERRARANPNPAPVLPIKVKPTRHAVEQEAAPVRAQPHIIRRPPTNNWETI